MGWVYTLELEGFKWYVGYSNDVCTRIAQHFLGRGALWTKAYKPLRVASVVEGGKDLEDPTTIGLMAQKGWRDVRGGRWTSLELRSMPFPLARALSLRHAQRELQEVKEAGYDFEEHAVDLLECRGLWQARVTGPLAALACPKTGVKRFVGCSLEDAKGKAEHWIADSRRKLEEAAQEDEAGD